VSTVLTATRPRVRARTFWLEADVVAIALVAAVIAGLAVVSWGTWGDLGRDTGYDFVAGTRVAHGQLPYVDFIYYYGPLAPFAAGLAAFVGGSGLGSFVALGFVLAIAIVAATYALARVVTGPVGAAFAAIATAAVAFSPTNLSFVLPHTFSVTIAILLSLVFLLGLAGAARGGRGGFLVAGIAAGLVALTRPEFEAAVVVAGVAWVVARRSTGVARGDVLRLVVPAAAIPLLVYGAFLTAVSPHRLFFENLYPVDTLRAGGSAIVKSQAPMTAGSLVHVVAYFLLYALGCAALLLGARLLDRVSWRVAVAVVVAVAALLVAVAAVNPEAVRSKLQWVFGGMPLAALLAAVLLFVRRRKLDATGLLLLAGACLLAVLAAKTYDGFFFFADHAQPAMYAAPFVLVALARLHTVELAPTRTAALAGAAWLAVLGVICVGLTVKDVRAQSAVVSGPGGSLHVAPDEAPVYRAALGAIESGSKPGDSILIAPQLTALYTLAQRDDPLREISLVPGALAKPGEESRAIRALQDADVRLVITDRHSFGEYGQTRFGASFDRRLQGWIRGHFEHATTLRPRGDVDHTLDVWVRRAT
jgi:hypothetical protein